jgi:Ferric uptake regulator family.
MNTKKLKEEFRAFLKKHNYKITKNRLDLIDVIANYKKHFEIEELVNYIQIHKNWPLELQYIEL